MEKKKLSLAELKVKSFVSTPDGSKGGRQQVIEGPIILPKTTIYDVQCGSPIDACETAWICTQDLDCIIK